MISQLEAKISLPNLGRPEMEFEDSESIQKHIVTWVKEMEFSLLRGSASDIYLTALIKEKRFHKKLWFTIQGLDCGDLIVKGDCFLTKIEETNTFKIKVIRNS